MFRLLFLALGVLAACCAPDFAKAQAQTSICSSSGLTPGLARQATWYRNSQAAPRTLILSIGLPDAERLIVCRTDGARPQLLADIKADAPFTARPLPTRILALPVNIASSHTAQIVVLSATHGGARGALRWREPQVFNAELARGDVLNGLLIGFLLALALIALLQCLAGGAAALAIYSVLACLMAAFISQICGYNFAWLWPRAGAWNNAAPLLLMLAVQVCHTLFTMTIFDIRRHVLLFRLCVGYLVFLPVCTLFLFAGIRGPALIAALGYAPLALWGGIDAVRDRRSAARFFLAGALLYIMFNNLLFGATALGVVKGLDPFIFPRLGYVLEAVCLALGLARQGRELRQRIEDGLRLRLRELEQLALAESAKLAALQAAENSRMRLAATSHDLRQPLAAIRYALSGLRAQGAKSETAGHIDQILHYADTLLTGLLDDVRERHAASPDLVDLDSLLAQTCARHRPRAQEKGLILRLHEPCLRVRASAPVLTRIMDNLISNALRYTHKGRVVVGARRRANGVEIVVLDTGSGIGGAPLRLLTQPFQQGDAPEAANGYGIGLYVVRSLCEHSGYRLNVTSIPGKGSQFGIFIPRSGM